MCRQVWGRHLGGPVGRGREQGARDEEGEDRAGPLSDTPVYGSRSTRRRRTRHELDEIKEEIADILEEDNPATVRQVYYRLVSAGVIEKTEQEYKRTVRLLTAMRHDEEVPMEWIADYTRWMRKPRTFESGEDALRSTAQLYRRALWSSQPVYVEVWLEKDALSGVVVEETDPYDVPLMVTRGYPSVSFLHAAAEVIRGYARRGKPAVLYYLGDHDPSGVDIPRFVEERIREYAPEAEIDFQRLAVTPAQIEAWDLPTRPTKRTDTRARNFDGGSVEVDAIPPAQLRQLVRESIESNIDQRALDVVRVAEASEREALLALARRGLPRLLPRPIQPLRLPPPRQNPPSAPPQNPPSAPPQDGPPLPPQEP